MITRITRHLCIWYLPQTDNEEGFILSSVLIVNESTKPTSDSIEDLLPLPGVGRLLGHLDPLLGLVLGDLEEELCLRLETLVWPRTHVCRYLSSCLVI